MTNEISSYKRLHEEALYLTEQIKTLTTERDEARRMYCVMSAQHMYKSDNTSTAEHIADSKNWDCYKKEETQ